MGRLDGWLTLQVEEREFRKAQREADLFRFAGSKGDAAKSLEASHRLLNACSQVAHVALDNLGCGSVAGVGNDRRRFEKRRSSARESLLQRMLLFETLTSL
jgi:hypothetical protein